MVHERSFLKSHVGAGGQPLIYETSNHILWNLADKLDFLGVAASNIRAQIVPSGRTDIEFMNARFHENRHSTCYKVTWSVFAIEFLHTAQCVQIASPLGQFSPFETAKRINRIAIPRLVS